MPFVRRDSAGKLIAISVEPAEGFEEVPGDDPELAELHGTLLPLHSRFQESDREIVRVLDDLVNVLIDKNLIRFTDLPQAAQKKLIERRSLRESHLDLGLLGDDTTVL